jgi:hypothetical protein
MKITIDLNGMIQIYIENEQDLRNTIEKLNLIAKAMGLIITVQKIEDLTKEIPEPDKPAKIQGCELC